LSEEDIPAEDLLESLRTRITQPEMPEEGEFVRIMSLHKSKGLTSRAVIVCGCVDGLIPIHDEDGTVEEQLAKVREQRRLFYVAMTRCTDVLMLSSFRRISTHLAYRIGAKFTGRGATVTTVASPFLRELGPAAPRSIRGSDFLLE
jgi:superfamily I DNA/RNA helicase